MAGLNVCGWFDPRIGEYCLMRKGHDGPHRYGGEGMAMKPKSFDPTDPLGRAQPLTPGQMENAARAAMDHYMAQPLTPFGEALALLRDARFELIQDTDGRAMRKRINEFLEKHP